MVTVAPPSSAYIATAPCMPMTWASTSALRAAETSTIASTPRGTILRTSLGTSWVR